MDSKKSVTEADVARMAELSRLSISEEEKSLFARQFADILNYMDILDHVDTEGVEPLYSPALHKMQLRDDTAQSVHTREEMLANAPNSDGEYFLVPRIV
jgi:aspartyl-tRNA(Asn)/glutamyl-tRNA(Gln) amidotransferase subunit C